MIRTRDRKKGKKREGKNKKGWRGRSKGRGQERGGNGVSNKSYRFCVPRSHAVDRGEKGMWKRKKGGGEEGGKKTTR